ncbi:unnamed protein product [Adineta ricciae]|uniref:ER lumen protein retaining receptor n=1 Tax=Adineta ricciae TaxID=249248 RepID=A0A814ISK1_ADIRI|nr:unnamed protein product [Adineta ricciae]CAF1027928.1 unnamed protein product [Adineta ricciae]
MSLNEYRLTADFLHGSAILLLFYHILKSRSCYSVSGTTVMLYTITFTCRYLDLYPFDWHFFEGFSVFTYNSIYKIFYLASHYLILILIYGIFRNTRDRSINTFPIFGYLICADLLTWSTCYMENIQQLDREFFWRFSIFLEMFAIIPQMTLIHKQGVISTMMSRYLMMLGSYRALYIANWIFRYCNEQFWEPIAFSCGCVQTMIYLCFFIHVYPRLNKAKSCETMEIVKEKISDISLSVNEKMDRDVPLIHDV